MAVHIDCAVVKKWVVEMELGCAGSWFARGRNCVVRNLKYSVQRIILHGTKVLCEKIILHWRRIVFEESWSVQKIIFRVSRRRIVVRKVVLCGTEPFCAETESHFARYGVVVRKRNYVVQKIILCGYRIVLP